MPGEERDGERFSGPSDYDHMIFLMRPARHHDECASIARASAARRIRSGKSVRAKRFARVDPPRLVGTTEARCLSSIAASTRRYACIHRCPTLRGSRCVTARLLDSPSRRTC